VLAFGLAAEGFQLALQTFHFRFGLRDSLLRGRQPFVRFGIEKAEL